MRRLAVAFVLAGGMAGILLAGAVIAAPEDFIDHFLLYKTEARERTNVTLEDQFTTPDSRSFKVKDLKRFGVPADKDGGGILDGDTHLTSYRIKLAKGEPKHVKVDKLVTNQFGSIVVEVRKPDRLLVPASKGLFGVVSPPDLSAIDLDHYTCYKAKRREKFERLNVSVEDQFTTNDPGPKDIKVKKPERLCVPVEKNGELIKHPNAHLLCYKVALRDENEDDKDIWVADQFDSRQIEVDTEEPRSLCVPSTKFPGFGYGYVP